jgi:hypothetical protein
VIISTEKAGVRMQDKDEARPPAGLHGSDDRRWSSVADFCQLRREGNPRRFPGGAGKGAGVSAAFAFQVDVRMIHAEDGRHARIVGVELAFDFGTASLGLQVLSRQYEMGYWNATV